MHYHWQRGLQQEPNLSPNNLLTLFDTKVTFLDTYLYKQLERGYRMKFGICTQKKKTILNFWYLYF